MILSDAEVSEILSRSQASVSFGYAFTHYSADVSALFRHIEHMQHQHKEMLAAIMAIAPYCKVKYGMDEGAVEAIERLSIGAFTEKPLYDPASDPALKRLDAEIKAIKDMSTIEKPDHTETFSHACQIKGCQQHPEAPPADSAKNRKCVECAHDDVNLGWCGAQPAPLHKLHCKTCCTIPACWTKA